MDGANQLLGEALLNLQPPAAGVKQRLQRARRERRRAELHDNQHARFAKEWQHVVLALRGKSQAGQLHAHARMGESLPDQCTQMLHTVTNTAQKYDHQ